MTVGPVHEGATLATHVETGPAPAGTATAGPPPAVAASGVTKRFTGGVVANDRVTFESRRGEVHALLGENGAGKTTLCNILTGLYRPDEGDISIDGRAVHFRSPHDAHAAGIFMVHQHLSLVDSLTVAENVVLGWSRTGGVRYSPHRVEAEITEIAERYHVRVDPRARVWQLSLGERQRVDILKALYRDARILILDEPTTVLTPAEIEQLFSSVREMVAGDRTVVFISHKLPEVLEIADRVTILRKGRSVTTVERAGTDASQLARLMVGHDLAEGRVRRATAGSGSQAPLVGPRTGSFFPTGGVPTAGTSVAGIGDTSGAVDSPAPAPMLRLDAVCADGDFGRQVLFDVTLGIRPGEILGIAGVAGNGQRELAEVIAGLRPHTKGSVRVGDEPLTSGDARGAIERGIAFVPEDRMGTGVSPSLSVTENLILKAYRSGAAHAGPVLLMSRADAEAVSLMERFDIRASGPHALVRQLSGGNVQKVVLARELSSEPRVVIAASPTRGLDVGATEYVRSVLVGAAERGAAIMLISEDLDEIVELSDRIAVLYEGRVAGIVDAGRCTYEELGLMMAGAA